MKPKTFFFQACALASRTSVWLHKPFGPFADGFGRSELKAAFEQTDQAAFGEGVPTVVKIANDHIFFLLKSRKPLIWESLDPYSTRFTKKVPFDGR